MFRSRFRPGGPLTALAAQAVIGPAFMPGRRGATHIGVRPVQGPGGRWCRKCFDPEGRLTIAQRFIAGEERVFRSRFRPGGPLTALAAQAVTGPAFMPGRRGANRVAVRPVQGPGGRWCRKCFDPEGRLTIAQRFIAGEERVFRSLFRPEGTVESRMVRFRPSLRDLSAEILANRFPSSELLGYCHSSLRDVSEKIVLNRLPSSELLGYCHSSLRDRNGVDKA